MTLDELIAGHNALVGELRARLARAEKVIQAARQLVEETRYLTVEQCERDGLSAGTGNRLRDALAEYSVKLAPSMTTRAPPCAPSR